MGAEKAGAIRGLMDGLVRDLSEALSAASRLLGDENPSATDDLAAAVNEMPRIDLGAGELKLERPWVANISPLLATWKVERSLQVFAGDRIKESLGTYASMLESWSRRVSAELQLRFNSYADSYRAQLAGISQGGNGAGHDVASARAALKDLGSPLDSDTPDQEPVPWKVTR